MGGAGAGAGTAGPGTTRSPARRSRGSAMLPPAEEEEEGQAAPSASGAGRSLPSASRRRATRGPRNRRRPPCPARRLRAASVSAPATGTAPAPACPSASSSPPASAATGERGRRPRCGSRAPAPAAPSCALSPPQAAAAAPAVPHHQPDLRQQSPLRARGAGRLGRGATGAPLAPGLGPLHHPLAPNPPQQMRMKCPHRGTRTAARGRAVAVGIQIIFRPFLSPSQTSFHITSHAFSDTLGQCGIYRDNGLNTSLEKSHVTGPGNFITTYDHLNFHPSYKTSGPSC